VTRVYVSVGTNIDREHNVRSAVAALRRRFGPLQASRVYESAAVGFDGAPFYNLVVAFDTQLAAAQVAAELHRIEDAHGRERGGERYGDRTLDLDLLLFGTLVCEDGKLQLPRAEIRERAFVLGPLVEVAPDLVDPRTGERYGALWDAFDRAREPLTPVEVELAGLTS